MRRIRPKPIVWLRAPHRFGNGFLDWPTQTRSTMFEGIEGDAGAVAQVVSKSDIGFSKRTRRPPRDPVNAMLGFCYGLLVTEFIGAVESVGLDYQMGFFHRPRSGRPSLALDLTEELRALTDRFVVSFGSPPAGGTGQFRGDARGWGLLERRGLRVRR